MKIRKPKMSRFVTWILSSVVVFTACGGKSAGVLQGLAEGESVEGNIDDTTQFKPIFDSDSAYRYVEKQVEFGPRVPNSEAHRAAGDWLANELRARGAEVREQQVDLEAFEGTILHARNIFAQFNHDEGDRVLLLAHWDCRPWADQDTDETLRSRPVDGANDGASGVGILLEIARQIQQNSLKKGIDILFVDAEDWGSEGDDDSWALGTRYFAENPPIAGYSPRYAILLDMVGGTDAIFCREYFSEHVAPGLNQQIWETASKLGYGNMFVNNIGAAVTDDHLELIKVGIPAVDIIEYNPGGSGFNPRWHTSRDNMEGISRTTLKAVGQTVLDVIQTQF